MSELQPMRTFDPDRRCIVHDGANDSTFAWNPSDAEHYRRYAQPWDTPGVISYDGALLDGLANLSKTAHEHVGCALWCGPPTSRETVCDPASLLGGAHARFRNPPQARA